MLLDICLGSKACWRVLLVLSDSPGRGITREEIKSFTALGGDALSHSLNFLHKFKVVTANKQGKKTYYRLNLANPYTEQLLNLIQKEKEDLNNLSIKVSIPFREFTRKLLSEIPEVEKVTLFGSTVKRRRTSESDIDLAIITKVKLSKGNELLIEKISKDLEDRFRINFQTSLFTIDEFESKRKKNDPFVSEIIRDGIILF